MFNHLPHGLGRATELVGAGRLMDATVAIQQLLGGLAPAPEPAPPNALRVPPTIEGFAEPVEPKTAWSMQERSRSLLGNVNLRDLVGQQTDARHPVVKLPKGVQFLADTFANETGSRPYKLYVPRGYRAGQEVALVVMLHGCTQSPDDFAVGTRMNEVAEEQNFLVVYPGQIGAANMQKCWNWFDGSHQRRDGGEPSLIAGVTRRVMAGYTVDPKRVFVAGFSAGGAAAAILGATYPDVYAAIGVHSGLACGAAHDMPSAFSAMRQGAAGMNPGQQRILVPTIVFHGDRDTTVNPRNGEAVVAQSVGEVSLSSRMEQGKVPGGRSYTQTIHVDVGGRSVVEQWVLHGARHAWSGGSSAGSYTDPQGPDASREMIRFFRDVART